MSEPEVIDRFHERSRIFAGIFLCAFIFYIDILTPIEVAAPFLYVLIMLLVYSSKTVKYFYLFTAICTILTILGGYLSPDSQNFWIGIANRGLSILIIFIFSFIMTRNKKFEAKLIHLSISDPLTGVYNRRHFIDVLTREARRAERYRNALSVLMVDIDHFKRINDTFGHAAGDAAIKAMADVCRQGLRPHDLLARYGGEEFMLALPQTDGAGAAVVAERLRRAVATIALPTENDVIRFTVSIGVAEFERGRPVEEMIARADKALYAAKAGGRDQVVVAVTTVEMVRPETCLAAAGQPSGGV